MNSTKSFRSRAVVLAQAVFLSLLAHGVASAVTIPTLSLKAGTGLTITGEVATVYAVIYSTNLGQPNWSGQNIIKLSATATTVPGTIPTSVGCRFYRVATLSPSNMVFIPSGTFTLGSPANEIDRFGDEGPQTQVTFSKGLFIGKYLVTQSEYLAITGVNPSSFLGNLNRPVESVRWIDATNYCRLLTLQERNAKRIPPGCEFRLPTEAEWENACRAGTTNRFYYGNDPGYTQLQNYAWFEDNAVSMTHAVGQKLPNPWGLYDMNGNVWQWCMDFYGTYPGGSVTDFRGTTGSQRNLRGGSWNDSGAFCRTAFRIADDEVGLNVYNNYGFRVVLAPAP